MTQKSIINSKTFAEKFQQRCDIYGRQSFENDLSNGTNANHFTTRKKINSILIFLISGTRRWIITVIELTGSDRD